MFKRIEATNYRLLKSVGQDLARFNVLIGPNASGKSTLFDVLSFIRDFATRDARYAIEKRVESSFDELTHLRRGGPISFTVEVALPERERDLSGAEYTSYSVEFAADGSERLAKPDGAIEPGASFVVQESLSLHYRDVRDDSDKPLSQRTIAERVFLNADMRQGWHARLTSELPANAQHDWSELLVKLGTDESILSAIVDSAKQPAAMFTREYLMDGIQRVMLDTTRIAQPVRPIHFDDRLAADGSNFAWILKRLWESQERSSTFGDWLLHVRTILRNLEDVRPFEYGDRSIGFEARFSGFAEGKYTPAMALSDGTLRLMALTMVPYLPDATQTYLIEEPENGIHPPAVESVYKRLSSVTQGQVLVATHSPLFLLWSNTHELLVLSRSEETGETRILRGDEHPLLKDVQSSFDLPALFESGILSEVLG